MMSCEAKMFVVLWSKGELVEEGIQRSLRMVDLET